MVNLLQNLKTSYIVNYLVNSVKGRFSVCELPGLCRRT